MLISLQARRCPAREMAGVDFSSLNAAAAGIISAMKSGRRIQIENRLALASAALVLAVIALERLPGESWWLTLLLVYSPQEVWAIPSLLLAAYFILRCRWWLAAGGLVLAGVVLMVLVGMPLPRPAPQSLSGLRVLTWNLYYGRGGPALPRLTLDVWPDVICLQEADPWATMQLDGMLRLPQFRNWYSKVCGELVILSRFPLRRLGTTHSALWASANVDGREVVIVNVHLALPLRIPDVLNPAQIRAANDLRSHQVAQILAKVPSDRPVVVCGDFNTPPNARIYRYLTSVLTDSFRRCGHGLGLSYMRGFPLVRIDHIFVSRNLRPVRCWLPKVSASNHRPVCADVEL